MVLLIGTVVLALLAGVMMPLRWGVAGLIGVAALLFALQTGVRTAMGFDGTSIEESLLFFNGSWAAYVGWNAQVTYRAFAGPVLALAVPMVFRYARSVR